MSVYRSLLFIFFCFAWSANAATMKSVSVDEAQPLSFSTPIDTVFISNPDIADYQVIAQNKLVVLGRKVGTTSLLVFGKSGETLANYTIRVNRSLVTVREQLTLQFPDLDISLTNIGDQVVLSGIVPNAALSQQIVDLVGKLMSKEVTERSLQLNDEGSSNTLPFMAERQYEGVVNQLEIAVTKQVNVKLTIAEVSTGFTEKLGVRWGSFLDSSGSGSGVFYDLLNISASDIASYLTAINDDSVGQILAEPNLSVMSGETASFLVGGELPLIVSDRNGHSISYKEFGVKLDLAAKVLRDDKIKLTLLPEVSSYDYQIADNDLNIPAFKTRRARTTVELSNGESFVLGGLLSSEERESLQRIPFIGDVPILGALFRHTETNQNNTELMIVATVNLVRAISPQDVQLPRMQPTSVWERWLALPPTENAEISRHVETIVNQGGFKQ